MVTCPICGFSENAGDSVYCTECGGKIVEAQPEPAAQPQPPQPQPEVQPPTPEPTAQPPQPEPVVAPPTAQPPAGVSLILPDNTGIPINPSPSTIGRAEVLDYLKTVADADPMTISRQHFTILEDGGVYYIEDGKTSVQEKPSANHTYLNGADVTNRGRHAIKSGDVVGLADTIKLTFRA